MSSTPEESPVAQPREQGVARATAVMAAGTLVSRILGLVSKIVLGALLGVTAANLAANSFDVANKLPNLIYALVAGGALNAVLVPQIVRADRDGERGRQFLDRLFTMTTFALLVLTVLLTLAARPLIGLYTDGWRAPEFDLAVAFALWCIPQLFFYGVYTLFGQLLNARSSFGPYTWAPVLNNVVAILGLVVFYLLHGLSPDTPPSQWTPGMIALLGGSATLGVAAQALVLIWPLHRIGFRWRPRWGVRGVGFRNIGVISAWTFAGVVVSQLVFVLVSRVASAALAETVGTPAAEVTASNTAWTFAYLLFMLPHSLLAVSLVTAVFTQVSRAASRRDTPTVAARTRAMTRVLLVGVALPAAGLALFGPQISTLLFGQTGEQARVVGDVTTALALGLPAFSVLYLVRRVFYAYEDGRTPFLITLLTSGVWAVGLLVAQAALPPRLWVVGIALSLSLAETLSLVLGLVLLRRRTGTVGARGLTWVAAKLALVVAVVGPLAVLAGRLAGGVDSRWEALVALLVGGAVLVAGYLLGALLLRVSEVKDLYRTLASRLGRQGGGVSSTT